jgi:xanthine dehydrogenase accessory factor
MKELLDTLATWNAEGMAGADIGRAVVVRTFGSAPRPEGAVLLYARDGRIAGSVSGGCVEGAAAEEIDRARATGHARVIRYGISDEQAWDVGLACGGTIDVLVEPVAPALVIGAARGSVGAGGHGSAVVTPLPADSPPGEFGPHQPGDGAPPEAELIVTDDGRLTGSLGSADLDAALIEAATAALRRGLSRTVELGGRSLFVEVFPVRPRLVMVGGVEVARSLVRLARELGFETVVVDGRTAFATPERFPDVDRLVVGWPDEVADEIGLGPNDAVAVLSHDVKFDEPAIELDVV